MNICLGLACIVLLLLCFESKAERLFGNSFNFWRGPLIFLLVFDIIILRHTAAVTLKSSYLNTKQSLSKGVDKKQMRYRFAIEFMYQ